VAIKAVLGEEIWLADEGIVRTLEVIEGPVSVDEQR
jgi:hypothetical protein